MNFDPTYNYGDTDLTNDDNLICWKFGELIKSLITLSSPASRQAKIIGMGAVCDEMADDFDTYFTLSYQSYIDKGLLTPNQVEELKDLDHYFNERSGGKSPDFWDDFLLETSPEWQTVRQKAESILELLNLSDLEIEFDRTVEYDKKNRITLEKTKTRLVLKKA